MNGTIAFTWSPDPKKFAGKRPMYQFYDTIILIQRAFRHSADYTVWPELNLNGNIHYHGILFMRDKIKFYKFSLPLLKFHGFVLLKDKNINDAWYRYMSKDCVNMRGILPNVRIPISKFKDKKREDDVYEYLVTLPYHNNANNSEAGVALETEK